MSKIYLVMACVDYEGSSVVKAFINENNAKSLVDACDKYDKTKAQYPDGNPSDKEWEEWSLASDDWQKNHPAGSDYYADEYHVRECELNEGITPC